MSKHLHIVIVSPYANLNVTPCVYGFIQCVLNRGGEVTLLGPGPADQLVNIDHPGLTVLGHFPEWHPHGLWRLMSRETYVGLIGLRKKLRHKWSSIIVIDSKGLVNARWITRYFQIPVWYWSLEILFDKELEFADEATHMLRQQEKELLPACAGIIIQDEGRAEKLIQQNPELATLPCVYIPNSFPGIARRRRDNKLHALLNIASSTRIVLYAGSFSASNCIDDIAISTKDWPPDWVLVIHSRHRLDRDGNLAFALRLLKKVSPPGRVFFSTEPAEADDYLAILDSADIGIAFYGEDSTIVLSKINNQCMGYASGKINTYLQAGLPAIVNDYTNAGAWVQKSGCGVQVHTMDEISTAIVEIEGNLTAYSNRAVDYFNNYLAIDSSCIKLVEEITQTVDHR